MASGNQISPGDDMSYGVTQQPGHQRTDERGNPNGLYIRPMTRDDADFYGALTVEGFKEKYEHAMGKPRVHEGVKITANLIRKASPEYFSRNFVAMYEGEPSGVMTINFEEKTPSGDEACSDVCGETSCWAATRLMCMFGYLEDKVAKGYCCLEVISVSENHRGKGIGKILLDKAEEEAINHGCHTIFLTCTQSNRAVHLYKRQGYVVADEGRGGCCANCLVGVRDLYTMEKKLQQS